MILHETISDYTRYPSLTCEEDLLAMALAPSCYGDTNPHTLAEAVVNRYGAGSTRNWYDALNIYDLMHIPGMNKARAAAVAAVATLAQRIAAKKPENPSQTPMPFNSARRVAQVFSDLSYIDREEFHVLYLDCKNKMIARRQIAIGSVTSCPVDAKEVLGWAMRYRAPALILVHNHPSGDCRPSELDIRLTRKFQTAGEWMDCRVLDHVIVGRNGAYYSLLDNDDM